MASTKHALDIRPLAADEDGAWDAFLEGTPGALVYHCTRYRDLLRDHLGCTPEYLVASERGEIRGVLPTMWTGSTEARIYNSLPFFGSHGAPIAVSTKAADALIEAWNERVSDPTTLAATMIGNPFLDEAPSVPLHDLTDDRISQVTQLPSSVDEADVLAGIESSARRNARKAERVGIEVERDESAMSELGRIHQENIEAIGGLSKPQRFFDALADHLRPGEDFELWVARAREKIVAALLLLRFNRVAEYYTPATDHDHRSDQPLALILIKAMTAAAARGDRLWNWGGTWSSQDGVYRFKRKWGAGEGRYTYFTKVNDRSLLEADPDALRARFPGFYVVPFSALEAEGGSP